MSAEVLASGWDAIGELADSQANYVKLDPGSSVQLVFVGTPEAVTQTFDKPDGTTETRQRYRCEVFVPGEGKKNFSFGKTVLADIRRQRKKRPSGFDRAVFEIERIGSGMQTKYAIDYIRQLEDNEMTDNNSEAPF